VKPTGLHHLAPSQYLLNASAILQLPGAADADHDVQAVGQDPMYEFGALEATVGVQARFAFVFEKDRWHGSQQLQGQLGRGRGPLPPPDLERPGQPQRSTTQGEHHEVHTVHPVVRVHPIVQRGELARLLETRQVDQHFESGSVPRAPPV
jgi:hypothetical protein